MILDLTSNLSFKVIVDFQGQSYAKHTVSALLLPVETQYVLPLYRKSWSRNPLVILDLTCDLSFKVIGAFQDQFYIKHAISALLLPRRDPICITIIHEIMVKESTGDIKFDL